MNVPSPKREIGTGERERKKKSPNPPYQILRWKLRFIQLVCLDHLDSVILSIKCSEKKTLCKFNNTDQVDICLFWRVRERLAITFAGSYWITQRKYECWLKTYTSSDALHVNTSLKSIFEQRAPDRSICCNWNSCSTTHYGADDEKKFILSIVERGNARVVSWSLLYLTSLSYGRGGEPEDRQTDRHSNRWTELEVET